MDEMTTDDLWLAAFAKPEDFKGDKLERLLFQRQLELARRIREKLGSDTSTTAQLIKLILEIPFSRGAKPHSNLSPSEHARAQIDAIKETQIPSEAVSRRTDLLEAVYQILLSKPAETEDHKTDYII